jgi:hypothetical protein
MKRTIALGVLCGLGSVSSAWADGFYAGVGVGHASVDGRAHAAPIISFSPSPVLPTSAPINGLPFDDDDTAWTAFVGYDATRYLGVEGGYWNHGTFESRISTGFDRPTLKIEEWYFGATLRYPIWSRLSLTGSAGVSRAQFEVDGEIGVVVIPPPGQGGQPIFPPVPGPIIGVFPLNPIPFQSPEDETGGYWRIGLNWRFTDAIETAVSFGKRDVDVLDVDSLALSVLYTF